MNEEILKDFVRPVTEDDQGLPVFSYSKMEVYKNCPYQYDLKYNQKKRSVDTTIALELGTLCHYVLEMKGKAIKDGKEVDYDLLNRILLDGVTEVDESDEKTKETILGLTDLKKKYWEEWYVPDNASGMNYEEKMQVFDKVLQFEMEGSEWAPYRFEMPFDFVWKDRIIITGFIDRIDKKGDEYKTVDYKTSKKAYDSKKLATSLQFGIYALAILNEFGVLPTESEYSFVLIDEKQLALTKGWEKRLIKALDKLLDSIDENAKEGVWKPNPTPLCHWCNYCETNPNAHEFKNECRYYSLWTPTNKTFAVNEQWSLENTEDMAKLHKNDRKLIF